MSHDLDTTTGSPAMAYVGEKPWHGLGQKLLPGRPIEEWIKAAKLGWHLDMLPVKFDFQGTAREMAGRYVLARSDTGEGLSVVSGDYLVVQPQEVLEFYRDLVATRGYVLETAGALDGGRKVWAMAKTGLVANIAGDPKDEVGGYLLLATSCDKTLATTVTFTSVRVVCQNTLHFAYQDAKKEKRRNIKVSHSSRFEPEEIKQELGLIDAAWAVFRDNLNLLANKKIQDDKDANEFFSKLLFTPKELEENRFPPSKLRELQKIMGAYRHTSPGRDLPTVKNSYWGLLNAITYYVDHEKEVKGERLDNALFGSGAQLKERAFELALSKCLPTSVA